MNQTHASKRALRAALCMALAGAGSLSAQTVFATDFENGIPAEISAPGCQLDGIQGYAGLGHPGRRFAGNFLHYTTQTILPTTLTLTSLPPHTHLDLGFLLAVIDSWDGVELLQIRVDGVLLFDHWFQLATGDASSYVAPPGGLLSSGHALGFTNGSYFDHDRAYDLSVEPVFRSIPHTAATLTVEWTISAISGGAAFQWQGGTDESWGMDAMTVTLWNSGVRSFGTGCGSPALTIAADPGSNPAPGGHLSTTVSNLPAGSGALMSIGFSDTEFGGLPLPLALDAFGLSGCRLYQDLVVFGLGCAPSGPGTASFQLVVPGDPALVGLRVYQQAFAPSPGANPLGLVTSNGLAFVVL